jgi:hypothetical protein
VDFSKFTTYSWTPSQPASMKAADERIVAAVERELQARGMRKAATGQGDVLVTYSALRDPNAPNEVAGTLVVGLLEPGSRRRLLQLRVDTPLQGDGAALDGAIDRVVAELFQKYPKQAS